MSPRIKCPHCGAGNRDTNEATHCWQCSKPLWEPADRQTYRLDTRPPLSGTTTLGPDDAPPPPRRTDVPEWKLWAAGITALTALVALCIVLVIYLEAIWRR